MNRSILKRRLALLIFVLLIATGTIYIYDPLESGARRPYSISSPTYTNTGLFRIDPGMILTLLDETGSEIFLPDSRSIDDRNEGPVLYTEPVSWSQSDNLKIVRAVNDYVWKDTFDD